MQQLRSWVAGTSPAMTKVGGFNEKGLALFFVHELDQINPLARAVLGGLQQIDHAGEAAATRQLRRDIAQADLLDRGDADATGRQGIGAADLDMAPLPDAHAAGDLAALDALAQRLG